MEKYFVRVNLYPYCMGDRCKFDIEINKYNHFEPFQSLQEIIDFTNKYLEENKRLNLNSDIDEIDREGEVLRLQIREMINEKESKVLYHWKKGDFKIHAN